MPGRCKQQWEQALEQATYKLSIDHIGFDKSGCARCMMLISICCPSTLDCQICLMLICTSRPMIYPWICLLDDWASSGKHCLTSNVPTACAVATILKWQVQDNIHRTTSNNDMMWGRVSSVHYGPRAPIRSPFKLLQHNCRDTTSLGAETVNSRIVKAITQQYAGFHEGHLKARTDGCLIILTLGIVAASANILLTSCRSILKLAERWCRLIFLSVEFRWRIA